MTDNSTHRERTYASCAHIKKYTRKSESNAYHRATCVSYVAGALFRQPKVVYCAYYLRTFVQLFVGERLHIWGCFKTCRCQLQRKTHPQRLSNAYTYMYIYTISTYINGFRYDICVRRIRLILTHVDLHGMKCRYYYILNSNHQQTMK